MEVRLREGDIFIEPKACEQRNRKNNAQGGNMRCEAKRRTYTVCQERRQINIYQVMPNDEVIKQEV